MKAAFLSASLSSRAGGIFEIERSMASNLSALGVSIEAYGIWDERWEQDRHLWDSVPCHVFKHVGLEGYTYSPNMKSAIMQADFDLIHLQHLWMYPSWLALQRHEKRGEPYIVTPNGMLEPWSLRSAAWKKRLVHILHESRMLRGAACLQANTEKELRDIRAYGLKNPVAIIPNGVDLPDLTDNRQPITDNGPKVLLFLGRIHPKKGLANALRAWHKIRSQGTGDRGQEEWQFVIAGWDQGGHEAELKRLCDELGLAWRDASNVEGSREQESGVWSQEDAAAQRSSSSLSPDICPLTPVLFLGPAFGEQKDALLRRADAFILPSFSEGLPMSVLEAWSYRLPVLMTEHCNLPEGYAAEAAIRIGTGVRGQESGVRGQPMGIDEGMCTLMEMSDSERVAMGQRGRSLVEDRFTWPQVAAQMKEVYEWVLGGGPQPDCVRQF
jgi:poly(glycerol-phosphate) alpha-glucosyltransferase